MSSARREAWVICPAGPESAAAMAALHKACFPHYWDHSAFNDFFSVKGTNALIVEVTPALESGLEGGEKKKRGQQAAPALSTPHGVFSRKLRGQSKSRPRPNPPPQGGGSIVAMLVYRVQFEQADIITLAVDKAFRRRGLARSLLDQALTDITQMGAQRLFLDVEEGNEAAFCLYDTLGFTQDRRRRQYYRQKDGSYTDALVMTKKLQ